ncbi:MAG: thioesterase family protein [Lachnospiraceae bacterium]|nr:thioesterase family protein [Lachnospiraceae bacterium]MBQ6197413.1 thioesterase family protein [Lachnospiraceae bacterium]
MQTIPVGMKGTYEVDVTMENTASRVRSGGVPTFSTPSMVAGMECCCSQSLLPYLEEGQGSVGISISVRHMASTPIGMHVRFESEVTLQDRRRIVFLVKAFDEIEQVGEGTHERFIIDTEKFLGKSVAKKERFDKGEY